MTIYTVDDGGDRHDFEVEQVPRIGECIQIIGGNPLKQRHYRVKDVMHKLAEMEKRTFVGVLIEEADDPRWPGEPLREWRTDADNTKASNLRTTDAESNTGRGGLSGSRRRDNDEGASREG